MEIYKMWVDCGLYPELNMEDVKDEIFDMAQPADPLHLTAQDLQVRVPLHHACYDHDSMSQYAHLTVSSAMTICQHVKMRNWWIA